jgi:hypothetical protein
MHPKRWRKRRSAHLFSFDHRRPLDIFGCQLSERGLRFEVGQAVGVAPAFGGLVA